MNALLLTSILAGSVPSPSLAHALAPGEPRECVAIDVRPRASGGQEAPPLETTIATADLPALEALLDRVVDRLERRGCTETAGEVLRLALERTSTLAEDRSTTATAEQLDDLRVHIELVLIRLNYRRDCDALVCGESDMSQCAAVDELAALFEANPGASPERLRGWLLDAPGDPEPLECAFEAATTTCPLPVVETRTRPDIRREILIGASSAGLAVGVTAVILGSVLVAIHQRCPGGIPATECSHRFSTVQEGAATLALGGVALIGSGVALGVGLPRLSADVSAPAASAPTAQRGWGVSLSWGMRF